MKHINFQTDNFDCWIARVGKVVIGDEAIPVYEISVNIKDNKIEVILDCDGFYDSKREQEFLDAFQKQFNEIQKVEVLFFAFIYSDINRYCFGSHVSFGGDDNPVMGFLQAWSSPDVGDWLTWKEPPAVADKREQDEEFRTAFERWTLAKFLQLVFGDKSLSFALPRYGSEDASKTIRQYFGEKGFRNGAIRLGKMRAYIYWDKVAGHQHNLDAIWDKERSEFPFDYGKSLTEADLEFLHKDLTE